MDIAQALEQIRQGAYAAHVARQCLRTKQTLSESLHTHCKAEYMRARKLGTAQRLKDIWTAAKTETNPDLVRELRLKAIRERRYATRNCPSLVPAAFRLVARIERRMASLAIKSMAYRRKAAVQEGVRIASQAVDKCADNGVSQP